MTPELRAAIDRVSTFVDAFRQQAKWTGEPDELDGLIASAMPTAGKDATFVNLHATDLSALVAALDPAEQPIGHIPTPRGINYLAMRREQQPPTRSCGHPLGGTVNCCGADQ